MRDYSQYSTTPTRKNNRNLVVTPSPASSAASFPNYRPDNTVPKSQVALLHRASAQVNSQKRQHQHQHPHPQEQQEQSQQAGNQKRDAGSISTAATQSTHDHSPRSNESEEQIKPQQNNPRHASHIQPPKTSSYQRYGGSKLSSNIPRHPFPQQQQQQQQQQSHPPPPPPPPHQAAATNMPSSSTSAAARDLTSLTPTDALSLKRDGPEATIIQLRQALEETRVRDVAEKANVAKSDAIILELRSSVRQLKRQLEKLDGEARQKHADLIAAKQQLTALKQQKKRQEPNDSQSSSQQESQEHAMAKEERVGEMQVQLDRAHAQLLTADMVRKELEDTLEAEQYTWELRVQDQERTIVELREEMAVMAQDLEQCRQQWKKAEEECAQKVVQLERQLGQQKGSATASSSSLQHEAELQNLRKKMKQLEEERNELQTCLDEALLELEAVDAELGSHTPAEVEQLRQENQRLQDAVQKQRQLQQQQQLQQGDADFDTLEGLKNLYRWLLERSEGEEKKNDSLPQTSSDLLDSIHHLLEEMHDNQYHSSKSKDPSLVLKVSELESQLTAYRDDLKAREESSAELRNSLKEAVALIKPLQDAVDKAELQKADLQQEISRLRSDHEMETNEMEEERQAVERSLKAKEQECLQLQHDLQRLQAELRDAAELTRARETLQAVSPKAAAAAAAALRTPPLLDQPQELSSLSKARADLKAKRAQEQTLRSLLRDAQNRFHTLNQQNQSVAALNQQLQGRLRDVEEHQSVRDKSSSFDDGYEITAEPKGANVADLEREVSALRQSLKDRMEELDGLKAQANTPNSEAEKRLQELESKLAKTEDKLKQKVYSEKVLNKSLKEALGLLTPLKSHLEEAETENRELSKELRTLRRQLTAREISGMGAVGASPDNTDPKSSNGVESPARSTNSELALRREKEQLEDNVRHLQQENSQLHDALDELSRMNNNMALINATLSPHRNGNPNTSKTEAQLNQDFVELKSRYEVTQSRLEDAYVENHTLVEALKEKDESEKNAVEGMHLLREKLRKTEMDLENAKYIATSALVKVEQVKSMEQNMSMNSAFETETHTVHSLEEKAIELDLLASTGIRPAPSPSNSRNVNQYQQQRYQQQLQQSGQFSGGQQQQQMKGWAGKRSRLADF